MLITVSPASLLTAISALLVWTRRVSATAALIVWLSGFTLATTGLAGPVNAALTAVVNAFSRHPGAH
ncbi:hypothetical protein ACIQGZ_02370 [Streptomyces sp. NPDC092296]|uniref:hypothetical protein n=1 Tax=Streptomyces sp. NPDC092296 TaxID=3366012 RepID=UPI0038151688